MKKGKDNLAYIKHIRDAINKIYKYSLQHTEKDFMQNEWDQAAIMRYFEIIGEAAKRIDPEFKKLNPDIEWRDIVDFRNFLIHDYIDVDLNIVWQTMVKDIPLLRKKINRLLKNKNK